MPELITEIEFILHIVSSTVRNFSNTVKLNFVN